MKIQRRRSSSAGAEGTTYVCEKEDGSICERNYEQLKKVNAEFDELMHTAAIKRIKGEPSTRQGLGAAVVAILSQAGSAPAGVTVQAQHHPIVENSDPMGSQAQWLGNQVQENNQLGEDIDPEEQGRPPQAHVGHPNTATDAEVTIEEEAATPTNSSPAEKIEGNQQPPIPHRAASPTPP